VLWHLELAVEFALLVRLCFRSNNRRWFQAMIGVDWLGGILQCGAERLHYNGLAGRVWEANVILTAPLMAMALIEAGTCWTRLQRTQRALLAWWIGIGYALSMSRAVFDPNEILLSVNIAAFAGFLWISFGEK